MKIGEPASGSPTPLSTRGNPYIVTFDGGADPNPARGTAAFTFPVQPAASCSSGAITPTNGQKMTNNQAEYRTLIEALAFLQNKLGERAHVEHVRVDGDSQLVINQVSGKLESAAGRTETVARGSRAPGCSVRFHRATTGTAARTRCACLVTGPVRRFPARRCLALH